MKLYDFFRDTLKLDLDKEYDNTASNQQQNTQQADTPDSTNPQQQFDQSNTEQSTDAQSATIELLQKQIEELKKVNNSLMNQVEVEKQPTFDECVYKIYEESRGIVDGGNNKSE